MNPIKTLTCAVFASAVVSSVICMLLMPSSETNSLDASATEQLASIQRQLEILDQDLRAMRSTMVTQDEMSKRQGDFIRHEALANLEAKFEALLKNKAFIPADTKSDRPATSIPSQDDVAAIVEAELKKADDAKRLLRAKKEKKAVSEWARTSARKRSQRLARRLNLNTDQSERMETALAEQASNSAPLWGTLKNEDASAEDRLAAIAELRAGTKDLLDETRNILSTEQFAEFESAQQVENEKTDTWFQSIETSLTHGGK